MCILACSVSAVPIGTYDESKEVIFRRVKLMFDPAKLENASTVIMEPWYGRSRIIVPWNETMLLSFDGRSVAYLTISLTVLLVCLVLWVVEACTWYRNRAPQPKVKSPIYGAVKIQPI